MGIIPLPPIVVIFFIYGLAFFTMGLAIAFDSSGRIIDSRRRRAMLLLAAFGLVHGLHEWLEMFVKIVETEGRFQVSPGVELTCMVMLTFSFGLLNLFGFNMLHICTRRPLARCGGPLALLAVFVVGAGLIAVRLAPDWDTLLHAVDAWGRYSLGVTGGVLAGTGLLAQARNFRQRGLPDIASGLLITGSALIVYGLVGQTAPAPSVLFPSTVYNTVTFERLFGFPVQVLRAAAAVVSTVGMLSALRALELERHRMFRAARARAQEELARREALQNELLRRTVDAQEQERARIARELHDHIGQMLTALAYHAAALDSAMSSGRRASRQTVHDLRELADQTLTDLRQLVTDLRPAQLDDLGLVAAIYWLADQTRKRLDLDVSVEVVGSRVRLPRDAETALFRIAQEALTNVARHAGADSARICVRFDPATVTLEVCDKGLGFDAEQVRSTALVGREAWGLIGMEERAASVGGRLVLDAQPGRGTCVRAMIPLPGATPHG